MKHNVFIAFLILNRNKCTPYTIFTNVCIKKPYFFYRTMNQLTYQHISLPLNLLNTMNNKKITIMKKLLLSLFVFAFAWTNAQVTYTVNVPAGTNKCYIAGGMNGWTQQEMTKVNATQFTITIATATTADKYKYCSGPTWAYEEKQADCSSAVSDRTYAALDNVACWAAVYVPGTPKVDIQIKVKVPTSWTAPKIHYWGDKSTSWPGTNLTQEGDWWVARIEQVTTINLLFHNGSGSQTSNITNVTASTCYQVNNDNSYTTVSCTTTSSKANNLQNSIKSIVSGIQIDLDTPSNITLYSAQGALIKEIANTQNTTINNLTTGIYIVNINGKSHKAIVK